MIVLSAAQVMIQSFLGDVLTFCACGQVIAHRLRSLSCPDLLQHSRMVRVVKTYHPSSVVEGIGKWPR
jgi:hypothetical protein